jgi:hypothetical protein
LVLLDGHLETQATIGVKQSDIQASNAEASYLVPVEVLELFNVAPLRFARGSRTSTARPRPATACCPRWSGSTRY